MNGFLLAAAGVSLVTWAVHVFAGSRFAAKPLLAARDLHSVARYTNYYCWHMVSIMLAAMAIGFALGAIRDQSRDLALMMTAHAATFAVWSLWLIAWKYRHPMRLPQWTFFATITGLGALGLLR